MTKDADEGYDEAFREQLARDPQIAIHTEPGREFLYRPGQLLVSPRDLPRVTAPARRRSRRAARRAVRRSRPADR
jgi:hypothetical protein